MCNLYNTLSQLCEERRITGYRMCKDCGISPGAMTDLKAGRKKILSAVNMQKLADYFGVTVDYLLCSETKKSSPSTDHSAEADELRAKIISSLDGLSLDTLESLSAQIDVIRSRNKPQ